MDIKRVILLTKIALIRVWRNVFGPIVEVRIDELVDRLGNKITNHELLVLFDHMSNEESEDYYHGYNKRLVAIQDGGWLTAFIGKKKDIHYWLVPWGGSLKYYSENKHLSLVYSREYVGRLKLIREYIEKIGYHPKKYGYITGDLLINDKGDKRFIIWNGHRRALSLAHSGYKKVEVEISGGDRWNGKMKSHTIRINQIETWENVKNGLYTKDEAEVFFNKYFL